MGEVVATNKQCRSCKQYSVNLTSRTIGERTFSVLVCVNCEWECKSSYFMDTENRIAKEAR